VKEAVSKEKFPYLRCVLRSKTDINERLQVLILSLGLNSNSFSVKIGATPMTTHKILSRKNNPGYDYICKVLIAYPKINARWLLLGEGEMADLS